MKKLFKFLGLLLILMVFWSMYATYRDRPSALYQRWFGQPVPDDVTDLEGVSHLSLTESIFQLDFKTNQSRIDQITRSTSSTYYILNVDNLRRPNYRKSLRPPLLWRADLCSANQLIYSANLPENDSLTFLYFDLPLFR